MLSARLGARANFALLLGALGGAACGGSGDDPTGPDPSASVSCTADPRLDTYEAELDKAGERGLLSFRFFDLQPAPPARGTNTFHVQVRDSSGRVRQAGLRVDLRMPDHGHGTTVEPESTFDPALEAYTVTPLFLFMPGVWQLTFEALENPGAEPTTLDTVTVHFCIEG